MGDLISRAALLNEICKNGEYHGLSSAHRWNALRIVALIPAVDAVPREEYEALLRRFRHLLKSDFIHSFDEYDQKTGTYKRDIAEADKAEPVRHGRWITESIPQEGYNTYCSNCKKLLYNAPFIPYYFCPHCGAKMDGGKEK